MPPICIYPGCGLKAKRYNPESFHELPFRYSDPELIHQWLVVLDIDITTPVETLRKKHYRVCSRHFDKEDFLYPSRAKDPKNPKKVLLNRTAIPRVGSSAEDIVEDWIYGNMSKKRGRKRSSGELSESCASTLAPDPDNLLGLRIQHTWREKGNLTTWKGTVLERLTVRNSLYMVKYDGFDCVYGIELFKDERVSNLQVLSEKVVNNKIKVPPGAEELVGRAVEHLFEKEDGEKNEWRGMVLSRAPIMTHWYYITYEKDPVLYMYQLWDDYKDGDLRVLPESVGKILDIHAPNDNDLTWGTKDVITENKHLLPADRKPGEETESLVGKQVEYITDNGLKRTGLVIYQVPAKPTVYYIKYDDDFHIHVYDLVKTT